MMLLTSNPKVMVSMEMTSFLAKFCSVPVRKACGKKNPLIQNTGGMPLSIQFIMKSVLANRSVTQEARGFSDG